MAKQEKPVKETSGPKAVNELQKLNDNLNKTIDAKDKEIESLKKKVKKTSEIVVTAKTFPVLLKKIKEYIGQKAETNKNDQALKHLGRVNVSLNAAEQEFNIYKDKEFKK